MRLLPSDLWLPSPCWRRPLTPSPPPPPPQATADDWLRRAELAVRKGQDDLAREALTRRKGADSAANALKVQLDAQRKAMEQLTANVRVLEGKVTEARNKKETLKSRAAAAKSSKAVQEVRAEEGGCRHGRDSAHVRGTRVMALNPAPASGCHARFTWAVWPNKRHADSLSPTPYLPADGCWPAHEHHHRLGCL